MQIRKAKNLAERIVWWAFIFAFINITWVIFRAQTVGDAWYVIKTLFLDLRTPELFTSVTIVPGKVYFLFTLASIAALLIYDHLNLRMDVIARVSAWSTPARWTVYLTLIWVTLFLMLPSETSEFVYFQF